MKAWQRVIPEPTSGFEYAFLLGANYDSDKNVCRLKFYDDKNKRIYEYFDDTGHKPYLLTNIAPEFIKPLQELESVVRVERVKRYDSILDIERTMTKVVAIDPLAVGGDSHTALKNVIPTLHPNTDTCWEDNIRYNHNYLYDKQLYCGMSYKLENGILSVNSDSKTEKRINELVRTVREKFNNMSEKHVRAWAKLLEAPSLDFHRIILDIEVLSPSPEHIPNPHEALYPVICVGFQTSDGKRFMFMLRRNGIEMGDEEVDGTIMFFDDERELVKAVFDLLWRYPFVVTFNGDEFDLLYLYCRSFKLHISRSQVPIVLKKKDCNMKYGFHIDLCKFFSNRSLQTYAFRKKYVDFGLDDIGKGLLGLGKLKAEGDFNEISYMALAKYCFRDVEITYKLTDFDDEKVLKLMLAVTRISRLPLEDVIRSSVSRWIRGFIEFEHRQPLWNRLDIGIKTLVCNKLYRCSCDKLCPIQKIKEEFMTENTILKIRKNCERRHDRNYGKNEMNSIRRREINVSIKDVTKLIREYLKSIMRGNDEIDEAGVLTLLKEIGRNCDYCVPIITELYTMKNVSTLIPRRDDILTKGEIQTQAVIKGKKFKGAIILKPKAGVHFDVDVVDFGSLYPSIVKEHNLGYETVNCNHDSCKENPILIPDTSHYICKENRSLVSDLIGSLKDIRIAWYKPKSKVEKDKHLKSWYGCIEGAIKQILNAGYGVFGRDQFAFYCPAVAEGVTAFGRQAITKTVEKAKSMKLWNELDSECKILICNKLYRCSYSDKLCPIQKIKGELLKEHIILNIKTTQKLLKKEERLNSGIIIDTLMKSNVRHENEVGKDGWNLKMTQSFVGKKEKEEENIITKHISSKLGEKNKKNESDSLKQRETNVNDVVNQIIERLRFIIQSGSTKVGDLLKLLEEIGQNCDYCVPIVTELYTGIEVLYGDTDSIFMKELDAFQLKRLIDWTKEELLMDFELDKKFRYVIFSERKKNYIGVLDDDTLEIKGLSGKKKHVPLIIRNSFDVAKKYLSEVKTEEEFETVKKATREVYKMLYLTLKQREWDSLDELAFHMALSKNPDKYTKSTPQHVKAALQLQEEGWEIRKGDIIHFIKVKGDPNVKPLSLAKSEDVDAEKYIEMLDAVFAQITEPMRIDLDSVKGITKMDKFFPKALNT